MREANEGWARYVNDLVDRRFDGNQSALAQAAGVASSTVTRWIDGATPQISALLAICEALDISMPELLRAAGALRDQDLTDEGLVNASHAVTVASVAEAISHDADLLEEARQHLLNQYELLLRISPAPSVAHGKKNPRRAMTTPDEQTLRAVARGGDPKDRAEIRRIAKQAREGYRGTRKPGDK